MSEFFEWAGFLLCLLGAALCLIAQGHDAAYLRRPMPTAILDRMERLTGAAIACIAIGGPMLLIATAVKVS